MKVMMYKSQFINVMSLLIALMVIMVSCSKEPEPEPEPPDTGKITLSFKHYMDGETLQVDTMKYVNTAGNLFLVTEVQYFISDVTLHRSGGMEFIIDDWKDMHYVDNDIPSTMTWEVFDDIPTGQYDFISFTFGISEEKNHSLMFVNPPERDMFWPQVLGGGYHYLKLNGKWKNDTITNNRPFEFHLGIGQIYKGDSVYVPDIIIFIHNAFEVVLPTSSFTIAKDVKKDIFIVMNIENWFQNPFVYDMAVNPENTMQYQAAMHIGCMNGKEDAFEVAEIRETK